MACNFNTLSDADVDALPLLPIVITRCTPQTKVRIINTLYRHSRFITITGDSVNNTPLLTYANVGITINSSSNVTKEALYIILSNDNFTSIYNAVKEGQYIFNNI